MPYASLLVNLKRRNSLRTDFMVALLFAMMSLSQN